MPELLQAWEGHGTGRRSAWRAEPGPDRILSLIQALPADAGGYSFSAAALKEREYRLYAESGRLLQQEPSIHAWKVVAEFLACRVHPSSSVYWHCWCRRGCNSEAEAFGRR